MPARLIPYAEIVEVARGYVEAANASRPKGVSSLRAATARLGMTEKAIRDRMVVASALGLDVADWRPASEREEAARREQYAASDPTYPGYWRRVPVPYDPDATVEDELCAATDIRDGVCIAFSDAHWAITPQPRSLAHEALLRVAAAMQPAMLLSVGDLLDLEAPSRHDPLMWGGLKASVQDGVYAAQRHLADLREAAPLAAQWWVRGNHDDRFDKKLAKVAPEFEGVTGTALQDHFAGWRMTYRLRINDDVVATHRQRGGVHAGWNNLADNGCTTVSGDTHVLEVKPRQFNGRRM